MKKLFSLLMLFMFATSLINASEEDIDQGFYTTKNFSTQNEQLLLDIPLGLTISGGYFKEFPPSDVPYILENTSIEFFNEGKIKESALYTIASIWAGNKNYNFINELEDNNPGIVERIRSMSSSDDFNSVIQTLVGKSNENNAQDGKEFDNSGSKTKEEAAHNN